MVGQTHPSLCIALAACVRVLSCSLSASLPKPKGGGTNGMNNVASARVAHARRADARAARVETDAQGARRSFERCRARVPDDE